MANDHGRRVRLGVIGLGVMGTRTLGAAAGHPEVEVVAVADRDPAAVARAAAACPGARPGTPEEVVARDGVDAVYLATPPASHAALAVAALRAGKPVFCEKPLAVDLDEGRLMHRTAAATGLANAVNFPLSDTAATLHVEAELRSGAVGEVLGVDVRLSFPVWPRPFQTSATWVGERAEGGFVREVFSHFAYLTDRLAGPLHAVRAEVRFPADPVRSESFAHGLLTAGGVPVHFSGLAGVAGPEAYEWVLWGSRRSYRLLDWRELSVWQDGAWTPVTPAAGGTGGEVSRLASFARAVRGEPFDHLADFAAALRVQEAVEAFHA